MSLSRVIEVAMGELKNTEYPPGSNNVKYNTAYYGREVQGDAYKWCLVFLWWVFQQSGERMAFYGGGQTASCGTLLRWYREQGLTVPVSEIQAGDIAILNFHNTQDTEHCGLVLDVNSTSDYYVNTVEGNTTPGYEGSQDNGGCVALKHRLLRQIVGVCRPQYQSEPILDYSGRWSEKAITMSIKDGVLKGYPDGSFQPTKPVTREELAQFYMNLKEKGLLR